MSDDLGKDFTPEIIHRGNGSDLMSLCGKTLGTSGRDQIHLSYIDDQVTCLDCLRLKIKHLIDDQDTRQVLRGCH